MPQLGLGAVTVAAPGTPVRITNNQTNPAAQLVCQSILIQALSNLNHTNSGRLYVKDYLGNRMVTLAIPTTNTVPSFTVSIPGTLALDASLFSIDADNAGDGADCSYVAP